MLWIDQMELTETECLETQPGTARLTYKFTFISYYLVACVCRSTTMERLLSIKGASYLGSNNFAETLRQSITWPYD